MKLSIMQPYLFPYLGYYSLIENTDEFVFFDTPQYIRKGWINRNRILSSDNVPIYFTIPVRKADRNTPIQNIKVSEDLKWKKQFWGSLIRYKSAPYYNKVIDVVKPVIEEDTVFISKIAITSIIKVAEYLGIETKFHIFSEMDMDFPEVKEPDEWALYISKEMHADVYVNPPGGISFFDRDKYVKNGLELQFLKQDLPKYKQFNNEFVPGLSIIDVMMFNSPADIRDMMRNYEIL